MNERETLLFRDLADQRRKLAELLKAILEPIGKLDDHIGIKTNVCGCPICNAYKYLIEKGFYD